MAFDLDKFVNDLDDVTAEERDQLRGLFGKSKKAQGAVLRQSDYDRLMNDNKSTLAAKEAEVEQRRADVDKEFAALATWKTDQDGRITQMQDALAKAERDELVARQAVQRLAQENGIDPNTLLAATTVVPPGKQVVDPNTGDFVSETELTRRMSLMAVGQFRTNAQLLDLEREHRLVFGTEMPSAEGLLDEVLAEAKRGNTSASLRDVWRKKYNVDAKLEEKKEADIQKRITDAVRENEVKLRSDAALGSRQFSEEPLSPALRMAKAHHAKTADPGAVRPGVAAAVRKFEELQQEARRANAGGS